MKQVVFDSVSEEMAVSIFVPVAAFNQPPKLLLRGEYALAAAVFQDAIRRHRRHRYAESKKGRNIYQREEEWIFSDDESWPFSFVNICNLLELVPSAVRAQLRSETKKEVKEFLKQARRSVTRNRINFRDGH